MTILKKLNYVSGDKELLNKFYQEFCGRMARVFNAPEDVAEREYEKGECFNLIKGEVIGVFQNDTLVAVTNKDSEMYCTSNFDFDGGEGYNRVMNLVEKF